MIRRGVLCTFGLVLLLAATQLHGQTNEWLWRLQTGGDYQDSDTPGWFGVRPDAQDQYDPQDLRIVVGSNRVYFGTYHAEGLAGWAGSTGFYCYDVRSALPQQIGATHTWLFYAWADPAFAPEADTISLRWYRLIPRFERPSGLDVRLVLVSKPEGITGGPQNGTAWDLSVSPNAGISLPAYRSADGRTGNVFELRATVIPEPSSLLALAASVTTLAGVVQRRRPARRPSN